MYNKRLVIRIINRQGLELVEESIKVIIFVFGLSLRSL